jgi:hypothetical protein
MRFYRRGIVLCAAALATFMPALAGQGDVLAERPAAVTQETIDQLRNQLVAVEARVKELEEKLARQNPGAQNPGAVVAHQTAGEAPVASAAASPVVEVPPNPGAQETHDPHDHMDLPGGGPALKFRGFFDFNFGYRERCESADLSVERTRPQHVSKRRIRLVHDIEIVRQDQFHWRDRDRVRSNQ